ncbi:uncharacterized protein [Parasteatoda tepidariorum]|uniref:uncharacterized protein n=1 Tax=Parasteatoda tepidariorum TaxID=114398 RepID=UPI001C728B71|nr:uncharacterized protein LOC107456345 [Parasteatoda tepidariorum]
MGRVQVWAYCHRLGLRVNTNMKVERWHREIKYEEADGKVIKRLDKSISIVLNAINRKIIGRFMSMERSKLTSLHAQIRARHDAAKELPKQNVYVHSTTEWHVVSSRAGLSTNSIETYTVQKETACNCDIKCPDCNICIHSFSCTCIDYKVKFVICKHIHLVNINFPPSVPSSDSASTSEDNSFVIDFEEKQCRIEEEKEALNKHLKKYSNSDDLRIKAQNIFSNLAAKCADPSTSRDELSILIEQGERIQARLAALRSEGRVLSTDSRVSGLKRISPQRKLYPSKKRKSDCAN